jgi:hypothetical protein
MGAHDSRGYLFSDFDLRASMEAQRNQIDGEVNALEVNRVLNTAEEDLIQHFIEKHTIEAPTLRRSEWVADTREAHATVQDYGRTITIPVTRIEVEIPFDGERDLFRGTPGTRTSAPPCAEIKSQSLLLTFDVRPGSDENAREKIDRELDQIDRYLEWVRSDVAGHNGALRRVAEQAVRRRRERILTTQGVGASLGIPLRERADAPKTYAAPAIRKKIAPTLPPASSASYVAEPAMSNEHYEHVLTVVQNMTQVMERSPSEFANMGEEALRQHYLVQLNGHFEGQATGETFNASGKTDILLRIDGKNVFIAECKFWKGQKVYVDTIDQLLGYSSWRDTKTAILIFNRNRDTSKVLAEIKAATEAHPNYKRSVSWSHESGYRFVMHHPSDKNRELIMTVLVFDIPENELKSAPAKKAAKKVPSQGK